MLKFEIEPSSSGLTITKPINQPVRSFNIKQASWFGTWRSYRGVGDDVAFTIDWVNDSKRWFGASSTIEVNGNVPKVNLRVEYPFFNKVALYDQSRSIEIVWHSPNQYVVRDASHEIARIYIYKASLEHSYSDTYVLTVLDEEVDLMLLFLYVFCYKFLRNDSDDRN